MSAGCIMAFYDFSFFAEFERFIDFSPYRSEAIVFFSYVQILFCWTLD